MGGVKKKVRSVTRATGRGARSGKPKGKAAPKAGKGMPAKGARRAPAKAAKRAPAKVAKRARPAKSVTRRKTANAANPAKVAKTTKNTKGTKATKGTKGTKGTKAGSSRSDGTRTRVAKSTPAKSTPTTVRIRDLDPHRMCGPGTSVERLIRVDMLVSGSPEAHLVYLDRHGWYCEHGRTCPAVGHARKHALHASDARR